MQHRGENKRKSKQPKNEWRTPPEIFESLNAAFNFSLDAAASDKNHLVPRYYTKVDDGLTRDWQTWTFCNPPFSGGGHIEWVQKAVAERSKGNYSVLIVPNGLGNLNFEVVLNEAHYIIIPYRRINYLDDAGESHTVNFHSLIPIFSQYTLESSQFYHLRTIGRIIPCLDLKRRNLW